MVEGNYFARPCELLHQGNALRVVLPLYFSIVRECRILLRTSEVLEASYVERYRVFLAADILDLSLMGDPDPVLIADPCNRVCINHKVRL